MFSESVFVKQCCIHKVSFGCILGSKRWQCNNMFISDKVPASICLHFKRIVSWDMEIPHFPTRKSHELTKGKKDQKIKHLLKS